MHSEFHWRYALPFYFFLWVFQVPFSLFQKMKIDKRNTAQTFSKRKENWPNYWLLLFQAYIRAFPQSSRFSYAHLIFAKKALGRITRNNDIFCLIFYPQWLRKARTSKPKSVNLAVIFYHLFWEKKRSLDLPPFHWHWGVLFNAKQSKERRKKEVKNHCIQFFSFSNLQVPVSSSHGRWYGTTLPFEVLQNGHVCPWHRQSRILRQKWTSLCIRPRGQWSQTSRLRHQVKLSFNIFMIEEQVVKQKKKPRKTNKTLQSAKFYCLIVLKKTLFLILCLVFLVF